VSIYTIGHSTRPAEEFVRLLREHDIRTLVDIRTVPRSRRNPQFEQSVLADALKAEGIEYRHLPELGGLRKPRQDSANAAWRNESFRGYADYMATDEFQSGLDALVDLAQGQPTAIMCAEAVPWRCHRSLVADALTGLGHDVKHIVSAAPAHPHRLTGFAVVDERRRVSYPGEEEGSSDS
jgi:uncharacterized protein (DUF488 family)